MKSHKQDYLKRPASLPKLGAVLDFMRLIWAVDHALQQKSKRMEAELGITGPQRMVLRLIARFPSISAGQLAKAFHLHPSTVTGIIKRLERDGFVQRSEDPSDRRKQILHLTAKGHKIDLSSEGTIEGAVKRALAGHSAKTLQAASQLLTDLAKHMDASS